MTPLEISLLLHIYAARGQIPDRTFPAQNSALLGFSDAGLIELRSEAAEYGEHEFQVTPRGLAYVRALMDMPLPVQRWEVPPKETAR